jgi:hypothetical protein
VGIIHFTKHKPAEYHFWRRGSESNGVFTDCQPQYPDFQGHFNTGFAGIQALFITIPSLPDLTRHIPAAYPVIEEIVEGFVEAFDFTNSYCKKSVGLFSEAHGSIWRWRFPFPLRSSSPASSLASL